jgi:hypothetical protein
MRITPNALQAAAQASRLCYKSTLPLAATTTFFPRFYALHPKLHDFALEAFCHYWLQRKLHA